MHYSRDDKSPAVTLTPIGCLSELQNIDALSRQELREKELGFSMVMAKNLPVILFYFTKKEKIDFVPLHTVKTYGGSRSVALLILNLGSRSRWGANITPWPAYSPEESPLSIGQEAVWDQEPVWSINPYPTAFPYGNGMVLHFYQQQESSMTKTVHKVINKGLKAYV